MQAMHEIRTPTRPRLLYVHKLSACNVDALSPYRRCRETWQNGTAPAGAPGTFDRRPLWSCRLPHGWFPSDKTAPLWRPLGTLTWRPWRGGWRTYGRILGLERGVNWPDCMSFSLSLSLFLGVWKVCGCGNKNRARQCQSNVFTECAAGVFERSATMLVLQSQAITLAWNFICATRRTETLSHSRHPKPRARDRLYKFIVAHPEITFSAQCCSQASSCITRPAPRLRCGRLLLSRSAKDPLSSSSSWFAFETRTRLPSDLSSPESTLAGMEGYWKFHQCWCYAIRDARNVLRARVFVTGCTPLSMSPPPVHLQSGPNVESDCFKATTTCTVTCRRYGGFCSFGYSDSHLLSLLASELDLTKFKYVIWWYFIINIFFF